jgi:hypothetical protein
MTKMQPSEKAEILPSSKAEFLKDVLIITFCKYMQKGKVTHILN